MKLGVPDSVRFFCILTFGKRLLTLLIYIESNY